MTAYTLNQEFAAAKDRTRRTVFISLITHVLLFCWLIMQQHYSSDAEGIVEITWVEPAPPPPPPVQAPPRVERTVVPPSPQQKKFQRTEQVAEVAPKPQDVRARADKMSERLASLRKPEKSRPDLAMAPVSSAALMNTAPAVIPSTQTGTQSQQLLREQTSSTARLSLNRGRKLTTRKAAAVAPVPREVVTTAAPVPEMESVARRTLEGASLAGPVADRPVVRHVMPTYPEWAAREAVEASVTIYFVVLPDGRVKENVQIQKTAGFSDFDQSAIAALMRWQFEPLSGGATSEQWGTITFHFRLRDVQ